MRMFKLGVSVDSLGKGIRPGIEKAADLGVDGVQISSVREETHPDNLSRSGRREFRRLLGGKGLELASLGADHGRGLSDANENNRIVAATSKSIVLARDLGTGIVTARLGSLPDGKHDSGRVAIAEALCDLSRSAEREGVVLAVRSAGAPPDKLRAFVDSLSLSAVKIDLDPANLIMQGHSPLESVKAFAPHVVHAYARDARVGEGEMAFGEGEVPWREYLDALHEAGYAGFQTIQRDLRRGSFADVERAIRDLERF